MDKVYNSVSEFVGHTPLVRLNNIEKAYGLQSSLYAKLDYYNPTGSAKDRAALSMINQAKKDGRLKPGGTIIEETSGNTGIGLASIGSSLGYHVVVVMPDSMSLERIKMLKAYGAEVVLTPGSLGMQGALDKAAELNKTIPNSIIAGQFDNPANPEAHFLTTGPEIWETLNGKIDYFVAGIGTGGTISGTGKFLKSKNPNIKIIGIEPSDSPLISKGISGAHKIQGIGANFIPANYDKDVVDEIMTGTTDESYRMVRDLGKLEGLFPGISSGCSLSAAIKIAKEHPGKNIVVFFTDSGDRYLSVEGLIL